MTKKTMYDLMVQFEEDGYVTHDCPICGNECNPTEPDNDKAYCEVCRQAVKVPTIC